MTRIRIFVFFFGFPDEERDENELLQELPKPIELSISRGDLEYSDDMFVMDLVTLRAATANFSLTNKLGQGGFGIVYKVKYSMGSYSIWLEKVPTKT